MASILMYLQNTALLIFSILPLVLPMRLNYPAIFNFGDSNSDTGNIVASGLIPLRSPYGQTFFEKPAGRFSDGRLIIDFIRESMGHPYLNPYLDSIGAPNFQTGCNFASGGATIRPPTTPYANPFFFMAQVSQFLRFKAESLKLHSKVGFAQNYVPSQESFDQGLYMFDYGQNDLHGALFTQLEDQIISLVPTILSDFETGLKVLYDSGARNFWIHNTGPLGCLSSIITKFGKGKSVNSIGCIEPTNGVAKAFNSRLYDISVTFSERFPDASVTYVDIYAIKLNLIANHTQYGFEERLAACCGFGGPPLNYDAEVSCGQSKNVNGKIMMAKPCVDSSKNVIWDGGHYTEAANKFISEQLLTDKYALKPTRSMRPSSFFASF